MSKKKSKVSKNKFIRNIDKIIVLLLFGILIFAMPTQNIYLQKLLHLPEKTVKSEDIVLPAPAPYPINNTGVLPEADITATGIVILDGQSGVYLFKRNESELLSPASTTKILTALVALDYYSLDDVLTVKTVANDGQVMGLIQGERITVENLLYGALIHSGNDAAWAIAENYPGGVDGFVAAMNTKAQSLHLTNSTFTNSVGYDDPRHKMTPIDLARLGSIALRNKVIAKMVAIPQITVSDVTHTYFHPLKNVNQLLGKIPGVGGIKTGWTEEAGENLITLVDRNGHQVIIVVLKSQDRFGDTLKLINWVFGNFYWKDFTQSTR